jgi:hypothetical protein
MKRQQSFFFHLVPSFGTTAIAQTEVEVVGFWLS